jgi:two-component system, chemotaxis family, response regulator Rcp1
VSHRVLLCVEDNDGEYYLIRMAVREAGIPVEICRVADGEQALHFLRRVNGYELAPRPDLILLNVNLPRKDGLEVLSDIRASDSLRSIPTVMFTSSALATEKKRALALGAEDFISKPGTLSGLLEVVRFLCCRYLMPDSAEAVSA